MQTGKKEAKILEDETEASSELPPAVSPSSSALIHTDIESDVAEIKDSTLDHAEIKEALTRIKDEASNTETPAKDQQERSSGFRSYEELKEEMKDINMNIKTETEIMKELITSYSNLILKEDSSAMMLSVLDDLEFYVHQYDNALDFIKMGGFKNIVLPALNSTNSEIRSAAAFLLGMYNFSFVKWTNIIINVVSFL